jgi:hypothetical protein
MNSFHKFVIKLFIHMLHFLTNGLFNLSLSKVLRSGLLVVFTLVYPTLLLVLVMFWSVTRDR